MRTYRVIFKGIYKSKQIAPFNSVHTTIGDVIAEVPVHGFFLKFRREEVESKLITEVWKQVRQQYGAFGYKDVLVEEI